MRRPPDDWMRMRDMVKSLTEKDWRFAWRVEMLSPGGFRYSGESIECPDAFLTAVGAWREDVMPKLPNRKFTTEHRAEYRRAYMRAYMKRYRSK